VTILQVCRESLTCCSGQDVQPLLYDVQEDALPLLYLVRCVRLLQASPAESRHCPTPSQGSSALQERQVLRGADGGVCCFTVTLARPTVTFDDASLLQVSFLLAESSSRHPAVEKVAVRCPSSMIGVKHIRSHCFIVACWALHYQNLLHPSLACRCRPWIGLACCHAGCGGRRTESRTVEDLAQI
jgi:hypothetical protein